MDEVRSNFSLNPLSGNTAPGLLVSLKLNNQLQSLLENHSDDSKIEIEFTSLTEGKIYYGQTIFNLKFSDSGTLVRCITVLLSNMITSCLLHSQNNIFYSQLGGLQASKPSN